MSSPSDMVFGPGRVIGIYYTVRDAKGRLVDSSAQHGSRPMAVLAQAGNVVPGLERGLVGKKKNERFDLQVAAEDAFGLPKPELIETIARDALPVEGELRTGMRLSGRDRQGRPLQAMVTAVAGDQVTLDRNHPLAGQSLSFEVTVVGVREATAEEKAHGHAHGPGGHTH